LARGKQVVAPLVNAIDGDIEAGRYDSALVEAAVQVHNNLARSVVINDLELVNVTCSEN
jgi:hypothetical protein